VGGTTLGAAGGALVGVLAALMSCEALLALGALLHATRPRPNMTRLAAKNLGIILPRACQGPHP